ncbi:hypothetical protein P153DRAFT_338722 [Dothidotthia symphoricarpi CBS 119687]|uniref:Protein kinase domain-containing protein n=1 Tax=Dothidotthia symphoricarpi CBS 119687 TaxID=1392245 RepID=A0A6A6AJR2_9PLEO|nr:uncharacterized protein P153DRAFT_338722 [Dothidotthia symphoricarpi CBS 119687]KAF2130671.1 hypothetical protein P153DRAFT_338722 [Dothidotthia symphoricarpi CBS 119687]
MSVASVSVYCRDCIHALKTIVLTLSDPSRPKGRISHERINDELEKFSLWMGNIGALHRPESPVSLESRLCDAGDVLTYVLELLDDLNIVTRELLEIISGEREGETAFASTGDDGDEDENEDTQLLEEIGACITRLFRVSNLIRHAAPTDLFARALNRNRHQFNDQFDIAHVGERYPKLATEELAWLQKRLGRAITQRRQYLSYMRDHREKLEGTFTRDDTPKIVEPRSQVAAIQLPAMQMQLDSSSRPSTFLTKASSVKAGCITPQMLTVEETSDHENDAKSYTTVSRSINDELDTSTTMRIPQLAELRTGSRNEVECPFCFRMKIFKNERVWRRHIFSDLRAYVCTFPNCDAPYFSDINVWFRHEMQVHRVSYSCQLCEVETFHLRERYLAHMQRKHPNIYEVGGEQVILDIARKPLQQICAQECPCCSEWIDRLEGRASIASTTSSEPLLYVDPTVFKRHLASHLEKLALFAIPMRPAADSDVNPDAAVKEHEDARSSNSGIAMEVDLQQIFARRLDGFFPEGQNLSEQYTTSEINEISNLLQYKDPRLCDVPRTYVVLRIIGRLDLLDELIHGHFSDFLFPVTEQKIPMTVPPSIRPAFMKAQDLILSNPIDLEKDGKRQHWYFHQGDPLPFEPRELLGGSTNVDKVLSFASSQEYARKRYRRVTRRGKEAIEQCINEIKILRRLRHLHIVELVGSYTDDSSIGLILSPVAEMELREYLTIATVSSFPELRTFFGCLATALEFMHKQRIMHGDIKPHNILVNRGNVLFIDFNNSMDITDEVDTTMVRGFTARYSAPEVIDREFQDVTSDVWSLGVVFLEMIVVLKGKTVEHMYESFSQDISHGSSVRENMAVLPDFMAKLGGIEKLSDNAAFDWVQPMLSEDRSLRPTASSLVTSIKAVDKEKGRSFCGSCCFASRED